MAFNKKFPTLEEGKAKDKERLFGIYEEKLKKNEKLPFLSPMMRNASFAERAQWLTSVIIQESKESKTSPPHLPSSSSSKHEKLKLPVMQTIKLAKNRWKGVALGVSRELEELQNEIQATKRASFLFIQLIDVGLIQKVLSYSTLDEKLQLSCTNKTRLALTCKRWKRLLHPIDTSSELKLYRNIDLKNKKNILPQAIDIVFMIDKRSPETSAFHCAQAIKHAVERIDEGVPGVEIRIGVIVFNKYPPPLEESHWIKGGFPPSAYGQAKACVRKRNGVIDPDTGMALPRFTPKQDGEDSNENSVYGSSTGSNHSHIPMLGDKIKQPSFLSEAVDEEDEHEIQKAWKQVIGEWLKDPLKRTDKNKSFVVKRFPFVEYERPTNVKLRRKKIKDQIKLITSHNLITKGMLKHETSFNNFGQSRPGGGVSSVSEVREDQFNDGGGSMRVGFLDSPDSPSRPPSTGVARFNKAAKIPSVDSEFDEDEDIDRKMMIRTTGDITPSQSREGGSSSGGGSRSSISMREGHGTSQEYMKHLLKRIPHKRTTESIGKWNQVGYKKVCMFQDEFHRWQSEQINKNEIVELIRLQKDAAKRELLEIKLYNKLLVEQRKSLKGFESLIESLSKLLDKNYGNDLKKIPSSSDGKNEEGEEEEDEEEEDVCSMNGSAVGAALEMLLGRDDPDLSVESLKEIGPELVFRPDATKLCFLISSSSPLALELHSKPPFQKSDPCGFDPIRALHELADRGIRVCPIVSKSVQSWDSALGFMQGVSKITKSSNPVEDSLTGGVAYIAPSELTAPYILQEVLYAVSKEMLDRDRIKNELLIHMNAKQEEAEETSLSGCNDDGMTATSSVSNTTSNQNPSTAAVDYRSGVVNVMMNNSFHTQVSSSLLSLQSLYGIESISWDKRLHDGRLPLEMSRKMLKFKQQMKQLNSKNGGGGVPAPPSPCELANIYQSSSSTLQAKLVLAEIEAEKVVRAQTTEVLSETRTLVRETNVDWPSLRWCDRVKICSEARKRITKYTREMRVMKANNKVEARARVMQYNRRHNTKFNILLKELCEGDREAFAIFLQARIRAFLIRGRDVRSNGLHDDVSLLSSFSSFQLGGDEVCLFLEGDENAASKLITENAYSEITYMTTDESIVTAREAIGVLSYV